MISVFDCSLIYLPQIGDRKGHITPLSDAQLGFSINRVFYLYDIPGGQSRGAHAHKECHQVLIAGSGSFEVLLDDGITRRQIQINQPSMALHIPPTIWASELNFSSGAVCIVLASHKYDELDYIRNYDDFLKFKRGS